MQRRLIDDCAIKADYESSGEGKAWSFQPELNRDAGRNREVGGHRPLGGSTPAQPDPRNEKPEPVDRLRRMEPSAVAIGRSSPCDWPT